MSYTFPSHFIFFLFSSFFFLLYSSSPAHEPTILFKLPWSGDTDEGIAFSDLPEGRYGPQAFQIRNGRLIILDNQNGRLKTFNRDGLASRITVPDGCYDFERVGDATVVHDGRKAWLVSERTSNLIHETGGREAIKELHATQSQLAITFTGGRSRTFKATGNQLMESTGNAGITYTRAFRENNRRARIERPSGDKPVSFSIEFPEHDLASVQVTGIDVRDHIYVHIETFFRHTPLHIKREIRQYTADGTLRNTVEIPANGYAFVQNDLFVDEDGILYHLFTTEKGIEIIAWNLSVPGKNTFTYPEAYHRFESPDPFPENAMQDLSATDSAPHPDTAVLQTQVTPEEALSIGDRYVQLAWECGAVNITDGTITDNYGIKVETPAWVVPGPLVKMPYKWGGFETIDQFLSGISNGKYAGDRYTNKSSGTPSAVGVDCSGFVSRCWKLSSHYSTRMMDDAITLPYDSWEQTKPGDAAHIVGHVRLIVEHNPDGTILMVESAGYNWRVSYRSYGYAALVSYTPRYYINMTGTPGNIPQPRLAAVLFNDVLSVSWNVSGTSSVSALKLSEADDRLEWNLEYDIHKDSSEYHPQAAPEDCRFYKLCSIATDESGTESLPSDTYGAYAGSGQDKVLIVDGFDRTIATSGSWHHVYHAFAAELGALLYDMRIPFETVSNDAVLNGTVSLADYTAVAWILGDESTADETFSSAEQSLVKTYLENGGSLFVSGSEIAWDLDNKGTATDQSFFNNYLKADYDADDAGSYTVSGAAGTPFEGLTIHFDDGTHGVYEEDYPDALTPYGGSSAALYYANQKLAAVYYSGSFSNSPESGKLFYMGFPFETIYNPDEQRDLLSAVMLFFGFEPSALPEEAPAIAGHFRLYGNYPNPFNARTMIRYSVPESGSMRLQVFNALGQLVYADRWRSNPGMNSYILNAGPWPSGIYLYRMEFGHQSVLNGKCMLLK